MDAPPSYDEIMLHETTGPSMYSAPAPRSTTAEPATTAWTAQPPPAPAPVSAPIVTPSTEPDPVFMYDRYEPPVSHYREPCFSNCDDGPCGSECTRVALMGLTIIAWEIIVCVSSYYSRSVAGVFLLSLLLFPLVVPISYFFIVVLFGLAIRRCKVCDEVPCFLMFGMMFFIIPGVVVACVFLPVARGLSDPAVQFIGAPPDGTDVEELRRASRFDYFRFPADIRTIRNNTGEYRQRLRSKSGYYTGRTWAAPIVSGSSNNTAVFACLCYPTGNNCRLYPAFNFTFGFGFRSWNRNGYTDAIRIRSKTYESNCKKALALAIPNFNPMTVKMGTSVANTLIMELTNFPHAHARINLIIYVTASVLNFVGLCGCCCVWMVSVKHGD